MCKKVSVIIPTHNRSDLLKKAIESVLFQKTSFEVEIIVIDDNSTEDIKGLCCNYTCRYIFNRVYRGANHARNLGVKNASGHFIAFLDSDDFFITTNVLQLQVEFLEKKPEITMIFIEKCEVYSSEDTTVHISSHSSKLNIAIVRSPQKKLLRYDFIGSYSGVMIKKQEFESIAGCDISLPSRQDWDLWLRMSSRGKIARCKLPLIGYRCHGDQISKSPEKKIIGTIAILNKHYDLFSLSMIPRFWKQIHCLKIILAASLCSFDLRDCEYSRLWLIELYLKNKKLIDYLINLKIMTKFIRVCFKKSYFFKGVFSS